MLAASIAYAQSNPMDRLNGRWIDPKNGKRVDIQPSTFGWEALHSEFGSMSVVTTGEAGANIKMSGQAAGETLDCLYYIVFNLSGDMTLERKAGPPDKCFAGRLERGMTPSEVAAQAAAAEAAARKTAEAKAAADAAIKRAEEEKQSELERIQKLREYEKRLKAEGPSELLDVELIYFARDADEGIIKDALFKAKVAFSDRASTESRKANAVVCGSDVSISAVKKTIRILMESGVKIYAIHPSGYPQFPKRITIEGSDAVNSSHMPITYKELESLEECQFLKRKPIPSFSQINRCNYEIELFVRYYDPVNEWVNKRFRLAPGEQSSPVAARNENFYFFWRATTGSFKSARRDGAIVRQISDGSMQYFNHVRTAEPLVRSVPCG